MRIDHTHRWWIIGTGTALLLAALTYAIESRWSLYGTSGGTTPGIIFGAAGYLLVWAAFLLWRIKKVRRQRFGKTQYWMKAHLWLGLLSYPLILFHAAFHFGHGWLTWALMWIFTLVVITGVLGAVLQHFMPRFMAEHVPMESIYNNIDALLEKLMNDADSFMRPFHIPDVQETVQLQETWTRGTLAALAPSVETYEAELRYRYDASIRPYLAKRNAYFHELGNISASQVFFSKLRSSMPQSILAVIDQLEEICREKRDLDRQTMLHRVLHGWLLVHVPLSALVIVLGAIHAVMALHYL